MQVSLIECDTVLILFVKELKQYFLVNEHPEYLAEFIEGKLHCENWEAGRKFQHETLGDANSEEELLNLFCDHGHNPGAVIAERNTNELAPTIYDKYRFQN